LSQAAKRASPADMLGDLEIEMASQAVPERSFCSGGGRDAEVRCLAGRPVQRFAARQGL